MADKTLLVFTTLLLSFRLCTAAGDLVTYWGQNGNEGTLAQACQSGLYNIVIISFLDVFGEGQVPNLDLAGHCTPSQGTCTGLTSDIQTCQSLGIKVLLSIGGGAGTYDLTSTDDASSVATYLWNNYLGGSSDSRPLGSAVLDGIDFDIEQGSGSSFYGSLATSIRDLSSQSILTAAPQCPFADMHLGPNLSGSALDTGLFDYVWVQFYNNAPCEYTSGDASALLAAWNQWTSSLSSSQVLLGLPASTDAASTGYIPSSSLLSDVLPQIKQSSNYGGVMLYSYYYDQISSYGSTIKSSL